MFKAISTAIVRETTPRVSLQYTVSIQDYVGRFLSVYCRETKRVVSLAIAVRTTIFTYVYAIVRETAL